MKVLLVEPNKNVAEKMIRMLHTIDDSIVITGVIPGMHPLLKRFTDTHTPDLVLINRELLNDVQQPVEAKLIIPGGQSTLVYLAYRINNLKYLEKKILQNKSLLQGNKPELSKFNTVVPLPDVHSGTNPLKKRFFVAQHRKFLSIPVEDIAYFFSDNRFIFFTTFTNKKFLVEYRMEELENLLDKQEFFRINRSYLVSIRSITSIQPYPGNRFRLTLNPSSDKEIIVSRERLPAFRAWLGE